MQFIGIGRYCVLVGCLTIACGEKSPSDVETCPAAGQSLDGDGERLTSLSLGLAGTCAVADDGTLLCWGDGAYSPDPVSNVEHATAVAVGSSSTCAVTPGGGVVCWDLFDEEPRSVPGLCGATALALAGATRCALIADGSVECWGSLNETVFGKTSSERAVAVPGVEDATAVAAGPFGYTCALVADGSVSCWGGGPRGADRPGIEPSPVPDVADAVALASSDNALPEMCAVLAGGSVTCWTHALAPTPVASLDDARAVARGASHACAVLGDGSVACWGRNLSGQLGDGTNDDSEAPVLVEGLSGAIDVEVLSRDSSIGSSCALLDDGTALCWGSNAQGALGNGTSLDSSVPVAVSFP